MAKLAYIHLKNFKQHKDTHIEFSPYITCFIGQNGHGKTNVLDALKTVLHHGDWREKNIRWGQKAGSIEVGFVDGSIVTRRRTKASQQTYIKTKDGKEVTFEGKKDCGQEVEDITGIRKVRIDSSNKFEDLNFIEVLDDPKMLTSSSEVTLRKLSSVLGITGLDTIRVDTAKELKEITQYIAGRKEELALLRQSIDSRRNFLNLYESYLKKLKSFCDNWDQRKSVATNLQKEFKNFEHYKPHLYEQYCELGEAIDSVLIKINVALNAIPCLEIDSVNFDDLGDEAEELGLHLSILFAKYEEIETLSTLYTRLEDTKKEQVFSENSTKLNEIEAELLDLEIKSLLEEIGLCPICGK